MKFIVHVHNHNHSDSKLDEILKLLINNNLTQNKIMANLEELKAQVEAQSTALDSISTSVTGIQGDVTKLKQIIADLQAGGNAAVQAALDQISPLVDGVSAKINTIGATTSALDAETE